MKIKPLGNKVVIQLPEIKMETKSGIIIAETVDKRKNETRTEGRVFAIGPYVNKVKVGDYVFIEKGIVAKDWKDDGKDYLIILENNIIATKDEN